MALPDDTGQLKSGDTIKGVITNRVKEGFLLDIGEGKMALLPFNELPESTYLNELVYGTQLLVSVKEPQTSAGYALYTLVSLKGVSLAAQQPQDPSEERYIMQEAAEILGVSRKTLVNWIDSDWLRDTVNKQVWEKDARAHYLTRKQLEQLARSHRRSLNLPKERSGSAYPPTEEHIHERIERLSEELSFLQERWRTRRTDYLGERLHEIERAIEELKRDLKRAPRTDLE